MEWNVKGLRHYLLPEATVLKDLEPAVYLLQWDPKMNQFYLDRVAKSFNFDYKIYDLDKTFIERVEKTWHATSEESSNLGILLHGVKGTGKSVTAKMICNTLKLPVILVTSMFDGESEFFNGIHQDVIIFIDEYEKIYERNNNKSSSDGLLSLMDGVLGNNGRKMFLLTSNGYTVNTNMMDRPSRILYKRRYGNLRLDSIIEIVDDLLIHSSRREEVIEFISQLGLITIDIIKSVVREVNIHDQNPEEFAEFFNVEKVKVSYSVYKIDVSGEEKLHRFDENFGGRLPKNGFDVNSVGGMFYTRGGNQWEGKIIKVNEPYDIIVNPNQDYDEYDNPVPDSKKVDNIRFVIRRTVARHKSFETYYKVDSEK